VRAKGGDKVEGVLCEKAVLVGETDGSDADGWGDRVYNIERELTDTS